MNTLLEIVFKVCLEISFFVYLSCNLLGLMFLCMFYNVAYYFKGPNFFLKFSILLLVLVQSDFVAT